MAKLHASRQRSVVRFPTPPGVASATPTAVTEPVAIPAGLSDAAAAVWAREAPFALAAGTLLLSTADAFALHCRNVAMELDISTGRDAGEPKHFKAIAAVVAGRLRFMTSPNGKSLAVPVKDVDPFEQFG